MRSHSFWTESLVCVLSCLDCSRPRAVKGASGTFAIGGSIRQVERNQTRSTHWNNRLTNRRKHM